MIEGLRSSLSDVLEPESPNLVRIDNVGVHLMVYPAGNSYDIKIPTGKFAKTHGKMRSL